MVRDHVVGRRGGLRGLDVLEADMSHHKEVVEAIKHLTHRHHVWKVFEDYCEIHALAIAQPFVLKWDRDLWDKREQRYLDIVRQYETAEVRKLCELAGLVTLALEETRGDVLGPVFEELELSSKWIGQFFTPSHLCDVIAEIVLDGVDETIRARGYVTIQEPACGAGAMIISAARVLERGGFNPQSQMHVTAIDKSRVAAHMAYIQLSLLGLPAAVYVGNTLSLEMEYCLLTPMHWIGYWPIRLQYAYESPLDAAEALVLPDPDSGQLDLFEEAG